jgi:hypothetical protein
MSQTTTIQISLEAHRMTIVALQVAHRKTAYR